METYMSGAGMRRIGLIASVLTILPLTPSAADTALECGVQVSSQVEIASCVSAQVNIVGLALDQALGFARDAAVELDGVTGRDVALPALEKSQGAWVAYRDAQCRYRATLFGGGSGSGIAEGACHVALTRARIAELMASLP
ncbi:lysozyme inhibitor LprI family protein [Algihabitans sp.]|uniref:lysozyme inhibitor LprI family protein n=1 Tax=Algihabitans sp. TaxID=2821514 RepID=UPI003BABA7E7